MRPVESASAIPALTGCDHEEAQEWCLESHARARSETRSLETARSIRQYRQPMTTLHRGTLLERVSWNEQQLQIGDTSFILTTSPGAAAPPHAFELVKTRKLVEDLGRFFDTRRDWRPRNVVELGIWGGGSVAFWF